MQSYSSEILAVLIKSVLKSGPKAFNLPKTRAGKLLQFKHYHTDAPI